MQTAEMKPILTQEQVDRLIGETKAPKPRKPLSHGVLLHQPLPDHVVLDVRRRWEAGEPIRQIAEDHKITRAAVSLIGSRQRRRDVV